MKANQCSKVYVLLFNITQVILRKKKKCKVLMIMVSKNCADGNQSYYTQRIRDHRSIKRPKNALYTF